MGHCGLRPYSQLWPHAQAGDPKQVAPVAAPIRVGALAHGYNSQAGQ